VKRLNDTLSAILRVLLTVLMGLLIVPVVLQIASRFIAAMPHFIWTEEVARFCFIWIIMIGATIAVRDGAHFTLDLFARPDRARSAAFGRLFAHGAMLVVAGIFVWFGLPFARFGFAQESELTGLNMLAIHIAWPLSGILIALFLLEMIAADIVLLRKDGRGPG
jgi:TRAP-type C4-dicarboxylate transport system permease small subunit